MVTSLQSCQFNNDDGGNTRRSATYVPFWNPTGSDQARRRALRTAKGHSIWPFPIPGRYDDQVWVVSVALLGTMTR